MSFANYKKNKPDLSKMLAQIDKQADASKNKFKDERFWNPTQGKDGNGSATIRFVPPAEGDNDELGWVQYHDHNFAIDGKYFVELCPTTKGLDCPICISNRPLWKLSEQGDEDAKAKVQDRKRKLHYISNIVVLKDKDNPATEGKVFLYKYGVKIFEKIINQLRPKDEEDAKINVFDLMNGADFRLEIKKVRSFNNYDDSSFRAPSPLYKGDDKKLEEIYNSLHKISDFVADAKFKTYDALEKKFIEVTTGPAKSVQKKADELFGSEKTAEPKKPRASKPKEEDSTEAPWSEALTKPSARKPRANKTTEPVSEEDVPLDTDDDMNYYDDLVTKE